jgi:hypothetical protein
MSVNDTAARHPNRFLADLTQAMRSTAETARQATIDQCHADAKEYVEKLHARTDDEAGSLRKAAEGDVSAIREWSKAEIEHIRVETEQRIARRRELLEQELEEYSSSVETEIERVDQRVKGFEEEVAYFFEQLLLESDPTKFASMAAQIPDPPAFTDGVQAELSTEIRARRDQIIKSEDLLGGEAAQPETAPASGPAAAVPEPEAAPKVQQQPAAPAAEAAEPATTEAKQDQPASTQVVVVGLISVASIASFKRQLGRLPGVKSVGVSSGPDGEFIFTVGHGLDVTLGSLIPTLPAFQARVVSEREGLLNVSAHDPEAEG